MNRLQKKCLVASAGVHLLMALILFIGPGFISSRSKQDDMPILNFVPVKTVDELMSGGGNPNAKPPAPTPVQPPSQPQTQPPPQVIAPMPKPQPEKVREPDPPKEIQPIKREADSLEPAKDHKKIEISTTLVNRKRDTNTDKKAREEAQARQDAKAEADARRRLARQIGRAADHIGSEMSDATSVEMPGPGGGGVPYANFLQNVKSVYANAWLLPDGVVDDEATTVASVTIARDGTVVSARITRLSGDSIVDRSVQATLDRVRSVGAPLPENSKDDQRTVTINFNVKAKRLLG